jgi:2-polyprenyl-3-methyl-5-hydroxy-6-metoxy-1,4-benzoquinol methylase
MPLSNVDRTNLNVEEAYKRGLLHRDYAAHYFRWSFALRFIKRGMSVLDVGCADGRLCKILYTNMRKPKIYVGVDISRQRLAKIPEMKTNFPKRAIYADMRLKDALAKFDLPKFDVVCCFEVVEHFEKRYLLTFLENTAGQMKSSSILLLSTPNFNGTMAKAHIYEYREKELEEILNKFFWVASKFGTFISQSDLFPLLDTSERIMYDQLSHYYDSSAMSNIFAPLFPSQSRNILWVCKLK